MNDKVLFVDDDFGALAGYQRALRRLVDVDTALGGEPGLEAIASRGPFAVIVADQNMPGMDGIGFLAKARDLAPDSVRMMLTGDSNPRLAVDAINQGNVFRFYQKPCPPETLIQAIEAGVRQHRLVTAERDLLDKTLKGVVHLLTDILALMDAEAFVRVEAWKGDIRTLCRELRVGNPWEVEIAAMLAPIGELILPPEVALKVRRGCALDEVERDMVMRSPETGSQLLGAVPRLDGVARIVLYRDKRFDGSGFPPDSVAGAAIPLGARILRLVADLAVERARGADGDQAIAALAGRPGQYDPAVLAAAAICFGSQRAGRTLRSVLYRELRPGMILRSDLVTADGTMLLSSGRELTPALLERVRRVVRFGTCREPIEVES